MNKKIYIPLLFASILLIAGCKQNDLGGSAISLQTDNGKSVTTVDSGATTSLAVHLANDEGLFYQDLEDLKLASNPAKGGLLRNIDKATGDVAITTSGWIEDEKYGIRISRGATAVSAEFDTAVTRTGSKTLKLSTTDVTGRIYGIMGDSTGADNQRHWIPIKASTKYVFKCYVKTNNVAVDSVYFSVKDLKSDWTSGTLSTNSSKLSGTNDWTLVTIPFTTKADSSYLKVFSRIDVAGNISDAWFDINSMTLEEVVEDTTFTGGVAEKVRPVIQAITSVDNIDQNLDPTGAYTNTYALTNAVNEGATHLQTFTPTKKYITKIGVWVVAKGTGNWSLVIHDSTNTRRALETIANADLIEGAFNYFEVPSIWTTGNYHFHLYSSVADGTAKANTSNDLETASYIQQYAKKSEGATVVLNGVKTELKADNDGLLSNAVIDLDNGKYSFRSISDIRAGAGERISNIYSTTVSDPATLSTIGRYTLTAGNNTIIKVNTILPIKRLRVLNSASSVTGGEVQTMAYSEDLVNWKDLDSTTGVDATLRGDVSNIKGNIVYIRHSASGGTSYLTTVFVQADLDTSSIPQGLVYPLAENKFVETIKTPVLANRIYYYKNKYQNEFGVVTPALEYTQGAGFLGYIPLKIDNSQETNPAVAIVKAETTNGQNSGTGSDSGANYILNDGEYMTLSASADELSISYLVGQGTTAFGNITKNVFYLSSNAESVDSTQDPSHQANIVLGVREQGLVDRIKDLGAEIADLKENEKKLNNYARLDGIFGGQILAGGKNTTDSMFIKGTQSASTGLTVAGAGNVGIGTISPNASSVLDLTSTTGALLVPRLTTAERDALTAVNGMIIYNSTTNKLQVYENGSWVNLI